MTKKYIKNATLSVRVKSEVKEFFLQDRGLSSKVLEDFYIQHEALVKKRNEDKKKELEKMRTTEQKSEFDIMEKTYRENKNLNVFKMSDELEKIFDTDIYMNRNKTISTSRKPHGFFKTSKYEKSASDFFDENVRTVTIDAICDFFNNIDIDLFKNNPNYHYFFQKRSKCNNYKINIYFSNSDTEEMGDKI